MADEFDPQTLEAPQSAPTINLADLLAEQPIQMAPGGGVNWNEALNPIYGRPGGITEPEMFAQPIPVQGQVGVPVPPSRMAQIQQLQQQQQQQGPPGAMGGGGIAGFNLPAALQRAAMLPPDIREKAMQHLQTIAQLQQRHQEAQLSRQGLEQRAQESRQFRSEQAAESRANRIAPTGTYIDKEGNVVDQPTYVSEMKGLTRLPQNDPRQKVFISAHVLANHIDETLNRLKAIKSTDSNRFNAWLQNKVTLLSGDPDGAAVFETLDALTPIVQTAAISAMGGGLRGSTQMAQTLRTGLNLKSGTLSTVLGSLDVIAGLNASNVKDMHLPNRRYEEQVNKIRDLLKTAKTGARPTGTAGLASQASGVRRTIKRTSDGKTFGLMPGAAIPQGYEMVQ